MFTQLSPKKEIAKNKPNTPKVLFNNKRTLYEQDWCIKESHQFSQPPAKNIPLDQLNNNTRIVIYHYYSPSIEEEISCMMSQKNA